MGNTKARAAVVRTIGGPFEIEDIEIAPPREHEVLVRMVGVGICHTDLVCRDGFGLPMPIVLGHEGSGIIEAVGEKVTRVRAGDPVVISFDSCGSCAGCHDEVPAHCDQFMPRNLSGSRVSDGTTALSVDGEKIFANFFGQSSFATHAIAHETNVVPVPRDLPLELLGPLGCGVMTGAGAVLNSLQVREGESVVIFGAGAVGISAVLAAAAVGASPIIVVEPNEGRCRLACELGATITLQPSAEPDLVDRIKASTAGGARHAIDTTANAKVIETAALVLGINGVLGLLGVPNATDTVTFNLLELLTRGIVIRSIIEGDADPQSFIPKMLSLYRDGRFPFDRMIRSFPFDKINEAAAAAESGAVIKPVLVF
ncbi:aryl-alcohol dehydrogenase/geraniol dehydrogenase (NAD+) [Panacagrimonas perspica]|uniref:Aryl-alcohol dehydrogenase/geraniol dehydrogenase (NAD+) n=1 Tax=Panacagrimonas perspica TaxID=381431 RepID=A0A4S3K3C6_9GAMM|nr:NAD(P)-dependent alcohol dehydrogenase [Panacagrimonas perspica]TDU28957.1 aryl-alcohol dehydrogenase/geraniol dehydrogenase (NAD+) [Panacagrimonas perspica]THD02224.1 NAD(P)-dependent alcohol dehydrogenase [Panacagrimonas perspica]